MRPAVVRIATVLLTAILVGATLGCQNIPKSATKKDFCSAGEKFSASTTFPQGVASAKRLEKVGTPSNITKGARDGFVQLINRVLDAKNGQDFKHASKKLNAAEQKNLLALNDYIQKTCKQ